MGVEVVELDTSIPFCAARARNEGYARLISIHPDLQFVQFVDGDCEIIAGWLSLAVGELKSRPELAIVAGSLRERHPERSIFNRLGDLEWNFAGTGLVDSVGGIFMVTCEAFSGVGGFDPTVPAGEEPELCQRLRAKGWKISRLEQCMAWHDLAMTQFRQWWRRMIRFGYGSMDVATRFGLPKFRRNNWRVRVWTLWLVLCLTMILLTATFPLGRSGAYATLLLFGLWPVQFFRIVFRTWHVGNPIGLSVAYGFFILISLWPQFLGHLIYLYDRHLKRSFRLVEYKTPDRTDSANWSDG